MAAGDRDTGKTGYVPNSCPITLSRSDGCQQAIEDGGLAKGGEAVDVVGGDGRGAGLQTECVEGGLVGLVEPVAAG